MVSVFHKSWNVDLGEWNTYPNKSTVGDRSYTKVTNAIFEAEKLHKRGFYLSVAAIVFCILFSVTGYTGLLSIALLLGMAGQNFYNLNTLDRMRNLRKRVEKLEDKADEIND